MSSNVISSKDSAHMMACVAARLHEKKTGIEIAIMTNWPDDDRITAHAYWAKQPRHEIWRLGDTVEQHLDKWRTAMAEIDKQKIDVPDGYRMN